MLFLPEIAQKHCYIQSWEHHIRNEDDDDKKEHSWPSNSCIVLVHHRWPILVEEEIKNAEKWRGKAFEVVDERRSILNINVTLWVEPNFVGKKQLSDLFEHDGETETKKQERFDFHDGLSEDLNDIDLEIKQIFQNVNNSDQPEDFHASQQ